MGSVSPELSQLHPDELHKELTEALERETAAQEILSLISRSPDDTQKVLNQISEAAARICDADYSAFFRLRNDRYHVGASNRMGSEFINILSDNPIEPGRNTCVGRAALEKRVIHVNDVLKDAELTVPSNIERQRVSGIRTVVGVPIISNEVPVAVIFLARASVRAFSTQQIALLQTFGEQALVPIENARLLQALTEQTKQVQALNETLETRVEAQVAEIERMGRLKRFLSPHVAEAVISTGDEKLLSSHRALIAVMFCDIRGFTAFCETAEPEEAIEVLQTYHEEMGCLINSSSAGVDHRMGDGIMVLFNDPLPCDDPAGDAVRLGLAMKQCMARLCKQWQRLGHRLGFGVGISLGYATVGMVGSEGRLEYTASGTTVNLAARICDEASDGEVLVSPRAFAAVESEFETELHGEVSLKGIQAPVQLHRVVSSWLD